MRLTCIMLFESLGPFAKDALSAAQMNAHGCGNNVLLCCFCSAACKAQPEACSAFAGARAGLSLKCIRNDMLVPVLSSAAGVVLSPVKIQCAAVALSADFTLWPFWCGVSCPAGLTEMLAMSIAAQMAICCISAPPINFASKGNSIREQHFYAGNFCCMQPLVMSTW